MDKENEENKITKLNLEDLKEELEGISSPGYAEKRMFGEIQKKINEIIEKLNNIERLEHSINCIAEDIIERDKKYAILYIQKSEKFKKSKLKKL